MLATCCRNFLLAQVIPLHKGYLVQPEQYPRLTLLGQALGAVRLGYEALSHVVPEVSTAYPRRCSWIKRHSWAVHS